MSNPALWLSRLCGRSVRRQLVLGVALMHAVLVSVVVVDMVNQQHHQLHSASVARAEGLASSLAATSLSWTLTSDLVGLSEGVRAVHTLRGVEYACILDASGRVLAHTDPEQLGRYVSDSRSLEALEPPLEIKRVAANDAAVDVMAPILAGGRLLGWARVGLNQKAEQAAISRMVLSGLSYTVVAILAGALLAWALAQRLSAGLEQLVRAVDRVRAGERRVVAATAGEDEVARLGAGFNAMLRAVSESEEKFRTVADFTRNWEYWRAQDGAIVWMAPSCEAATGHPAGDFLGDSGLLRRVVHPADLESFDRHMLEVESGSQAPGELLLRVRHKSGRLLWFEHHCQDITAADGTLLGRRVCNMDVTERMQAEEGQRRWAQVFENAAWGIVICSPRSRRLEALNPAFARMHGFESAELLGQPVSMVYPPEKLEWVYAQLALSHSSGHHVFEAEHQRKDGSRFPARMDVTAVKDEAGQVLYRVVNVQDITESRRARDELVKAKEAAEAANAAKSEFLAVISHELRTPLNGIKGMLYVLRDAQLSAEERHEHFGHALAATDNLALVLNDVLDITRIEAGKLVLLEETFSLEEILAPVCANVEAAARAKGLELVSSTDARLPARFQGDAGRIRQILLNLMGNAVKFTDKGSVRLEVYPLHVTSAAAAAGRLPVHFAVRDTGVGMAEEELQRIFEPFTQLEPALTRSHGGAGLGLAIVRRLTDLLGGGIQVFSEPGRGTEFHLTLPLRVPNRKSSAPEPPSLPQADAREGKARVLVVEDDALNLCAAVKILESMDFDVQAASDGQTALDTLARDPRFDVVLMDIQMPGMDGIEATRRIRGMGDAGVAPDIPVVAVSAHAMQGDRERFLAAGLDDYLPKPYAPEALRNILRRVLAERGRVL